MRPGDTVLVTGAAGFIGRAVVADLLEHGFTVRAMVRGAASFPENPRLTVVNADMKDAARLNAAVSGMTAVVHLAAVVVDIHRLLCPLTR